MKTASIKTFIPYPYLRNDRLKKQIVVFILLCFLLAVHSATGQSADMILINGKIFTSDTTQLYVEALAIKGNKISTTGNSSSVRKLSGPKTRIIDLAGKTVVPGFNDAHDHLAWLIPDKNGFNTPFSIPGISRQALIDSLSRLIKTARPGNWIHGTIGLTVFNDTSVRRRLLDSISSRHPLVLTIMWGHGMIVNSTALAAMHISDTAVDPPGGWYERLPANRLITGALYEYAQFPYWEKLTLAIPETQLVNSLRNYADLQLSFGVTTVQNMSSTLQGRAAKNIFSKANLPVRTRLIAMPGSNDMQRDLTEWNTSAPGPSPRTYSSGIKYIIDGTSLEQTALRTSAYPGRPTYYGRLNFPVDTIRQILQESLTSNRQLMLHVTGDSATSLVINMMKGMAEPGTWSKKRVRIEHGTGIMSASIAKDIKDLGVIIVHTPQYGSYSPVASWLKLGIPVAIGPDGLMSPGVNIMMITSTQKNPSENITREQAVIAYTKGGAYAEFTDQIKGTLKPGMIADLAVLSQDIFTVPAEMLPRTKSVMTIIDGKVIYEAATGK